MRQNGWMIPATLIAVYFTYTGVLTTLLATLIGNNLLTWLSTLGSIIMPIFRAK
jgi:hypothetical protein